MRSTRKMLAPVVAPLRPVVALDGEDELVDGLRQLAQPGVVFVGVFGRRREQLDHGAERALRAEDRARGRDRPAARSAIDRRSNPCCRISADQSKSILGKSRDEDRALEHDVGDAIWRSRDLPPPETVHGLWQKSAVGARADQPPGRAAGLLLQADLVAGGQHVDVARRAAAMRALAAVRAS